MLSSNSPVSKAHIVAISLSLAFWLFGLSRLGFNSKLKIHNRKRANLTAVVLVLAVIGSAADIWSRPIAHRLVFVIVFGWTAKTSIELIKDNKTAYNNSYKT
jgi:hypothetical protein